VKILTQFFRLALFQESRHSNSLMTEIVAYLVGFLHQIGHVLILFLLKFKKLVRIGKFGFCFVSFQHISSDIDGNVVPGHQCQEENTKASEKNGFFVYVIRPDYKDYVEADASQKRREGKEIPGFGIRLLSCKRGDEFTDEDN
jgi:hypothetical protein